MMDDAPEVVVPRGRMIDSSEIDEFLRQSRLSRAKTNKTTKKQKTTDVFIKSFQKGL